MRVKIFRCPDCNKEHQKKIYVNASEGVADIFTENFFEPIWEKFKDKEHDHLEKFCKELMFFTIYTYHMKRRRIHVAKDSIEQSNGTESPEH
jgi:hypothetical protein